MAKSRRHRNRHSKKSNSKKYRRSFNKSIKSFKRRTIESLPVINKGLTNFGSSVKTVAIKSTPVIEKGLGSVYGTLATGFQYIGDKTRSNSSNKKSHRR
jgi:hypothetical protein